MIAKLRANYMLANVLSKILLALAYVFASWKTFAGLMTMMLGSAAWPTILLGCSFSGAVMVVLAHFLPKLYLKFAKIYTVPHSEFSLLATLAFAMYYLMVGLLNLILLAVPTFLVWADALFPIVSALVCWLVFYSVTGKLYFNDVTKPYYFATISIAVIALAVLGGVV